MSVTVTLAGTDHTTDIDRTSLQVQQIIGSQRDSATLIYKKYGSKSYVPAVFDTVLIQDGSTKIFGGRIATIKQTSINAASGIIYEVACVDYSIDLDSELVQQEYVNTSVHDIIADFATNFSTGFTVNNVDCAFVVSDIVFNQVPISQAIKQLADLVQYNWYVDADKDIHFFPKYTMLSPFNLTDTSGNYFNMTLETNSDATQLANQVKVRGGTYQGTSYSDTITVKGNVTKSWVLPYKFDPTTLTVTINGVSKTVGTYGIDTFSTKDVLYRDSDQSIQVQTARSDSDTVAFTGTPLIPVLAVAADATSIALYTAREKIIEDSSITDINVARQRAVAELNAYKDPLQEAKFLTTSAGLRTGQVININSSRRSLNTDFIIRKVTFKIFTPTAFIYEVELVTVRGFTLIEVLQALLLPAAKPIDPNEVSEIIKTDFATVTTAENIAKDPLGAGLSPTWVLGPYNPSGVADTKRIVCVETQSATLY
jgi:hypothetical protein